MTTKYTKKITFYCLCLSILLAKNTFANFTLGNSGVTFSGAVKWEDNINLTTSQNYGKYPRGRYVTELDYLRIDGNFKGSHTLNIPGNLIWELDNRIYTFNKSLAVELSRIAYVGIESKLGTLQAGKFYTPTDELMFLNSLNGDLFAGLSASYLLETNLDPIYKTDGAKEDFTYVAQYNAAIQYSLPKDLVKGLEIKLLVATDPNANQDDVDKKVNTQYPWGVDGYIKYTTDNGFFIATSYAESHTLGMDGKFKGNLREIYRPIYREIIQEYLSTHRVVLTKFGYNNNGLNITAGYRNIYYKKILNDIIVSEFITENDYYYETILKATTYSIDHSYALALDLGYKLGNNNFAIGYEVKPKYTDLRLNLITASYGYNFTSKFLIEAQLNHFFNTERTESENFNSAKNSFIKNSVTNLVTRIKLTF